MEWSTFWASFKATIDDRKDLSNTQKLHYLRQAVKDPDIQLLLHSPTETSSMYEEVVKELKERFNKTREIHREVVKSLLQLQTPKQTRVELRRLTDTMKRHMDSLKAIEHFSIESFLTSFLYLILPNKLQLLWEQSIKKEKGVPPISRLLSFVRDHAESLPSSTATYSEWPAEAPGKRNPRKQDRRQDNQSPRPRSNVHQLPATSGSVPCVLRKSILCMCAQNGLPSMLPKDWDTSRPRHSALTAWQEATSLATARASTDAGSVASSITPLYINSLLL